MKESFNLNRRSFLQKMGIGAATPFALNLAAIGEAAAFNAGNDYKALVCVFLNGGNDHGNTVIPVDNTGYSEYQNIRGSLALPLTSINNNILNPSVQLEGGKQFALAPGLEPLVSLFNQRKLSIQLNVGTLIEPTSVQQYKNKAVALPPKLFSHNDQQSFWQSSRAEGATQGWGGSIGDLSMSSNGNGSSFTCISTTGNAVFLAGSKVFPYRVTNNGAIPIEALTDYFCGQTGNCGEVLRRIITEGRENIFENELNKINSRSINYQSVVSQAFDNSKQVEAAFSNVASDNALAAQLKTVAKLIEGRNYLANKRQVFMVSLGGFDTHTELLRLHPILMKKVGEAMAAFEAAMTLIGMSNSVTTFTASDFGRTLSPNNDGSDHGWGSHHFIMGGALNGGRFFGTPPSYKLNTGEDVGRGVWVPTTSVDQYAGSLASWFGVTDAEMPSVLPNINNFANKNLRYFK